MSDQSPVQPDTKPVKDYTPPIPEQIKRQIAEAEQIRAQLEPAAPEGEAEAAPPEEGLEGQPPQPEAPIAFTPPVEDDGQSWEQRFKSQQGRLEQERKVNQALAERLQSLEGQLATMKIRGAEEVRPEAAVPKVKPKLITDQEAEEYGEEFLNVVAKRAKEEYSPEFEELADRLKRLEGRVEGVGTVIEKTQTQDIYQNLAAAVPQWREINRSDQFKLWLQQPDAYSGRRRHDLLTEAFSRHEANRVVTFFRGFLTEATGLPQAPQAQAPSAPPPANGSGSGKPSLEQFAAPGRARSAPQPLPPDKPIYTHAWIAKFTADKIAGKYRGRQEDADAIEQDIYRAQHEGRIQP
jgi:hypothetical protein